MSSFVEDAEERLHMHESALEQIDSKIHETNKNLVQLFKRQHALKEAVERDKEHLRKLKGT